MSYRSGHHSEYHQHHHPQDYGRTPTRRPIPHAASAAVAQAGDGYTLVHAGRQVRFGPVVFWIVVGTIVLLGLWSAATATYFAFRDDVLTRLIARQAEMQYAYEDRIAELRSKVDRTTSRQLLDQEQFDQKLDQIMRRQAALESRATALGAIPDATATGSIRPPARGAATDPAPSGTPKPSPISDTVIFVAPPDREARLESRAPINASPQPNQFAKAQGFDNVLVRLQTSLDQVERRQLATLSSVEESIESRVRRMRGVINDLGLDIGQLEAATPRSGVGGPFVPVKLPADAGPFERQLQRIKCPDAAPQRDAGAGALSQASHRRGRIHLRFWCPQRSLPRPPRDAYRPRLPCRDGRSRARHRERQGGVVGMGRRLWPHGRNRPWQWLVDALRPSLRDQRQGRRVDRPAAPPGRICIMKPGSTATPSTRRNFCARASD